MKKSKLHLQMNLSKFSEMKIKELYKIPQDQKIELAIWAGKAFDKDIRENGFVFTNIAMYWNFPTSGETPEADNLVEKEAVFKSVETSVNEITLRTDAKEVKFVLNEKFTTDDAAFIKSVISSYYTDYKLTKNFSQEIISKDENNSIIFTYLMTSDFFTEGTAKFKERFAKKEKEDNSVSATSDVNAVEESPTNETTEETTEETKNEKKTKAKQNKTDGQKPKVGFFTKFGHFWRHILDVIVDLILILGIVLLLKPDLFPKNEVIVEIPEIQEQFYLDESEDEAIEHAEEVPSSASTMLSNEEAILIPEEPSLNTMSVSNSSSDANKSMSVSSSSKDTKDSEKNITEGKISKNAAKELKAEYKRKKAELKAQKKMLRKQNSEIFYRNYGRSILCFAIFIILKILIIASSNKSRKAVSIMLLAILIVFTVCAFIPNTSPNAAEYAKLIPFGIYLIILSLILLCLQFSMGFEARAVGRKIFWFILIVAVGYIWIHASLPEFSDKMKLAGEQIGEAFSMLNVPVKWW